MEVGCCFKGQHFCWTIQEAFDFFSIPIEKQKDFSAQKEKHNMKEQKKQASGGTCWNKLGNGSSGLRLSRC